MIGNSSNVLDAQRFAKPVEFSGYELWAIITDNCVAVALACENFSQEFDGFGRCHQACFKYFWPLAEGIHDDQVVTSVDRTGVVEVNARPQALRSWPWLQRAFDWSFPYFCTTFTTPDGSFDISVDLGPKHLTACE